MACRPYLIIVASLFLLASFEGTAAARSWDCRYQDAAGNQLVTHFTKDGSTLIEPHWPQPTAYRVVVDDNDMLIAIHAYIVPRGFRQSARGGAVVLILNKATGRMRRSLGASGEDTDRVDFGLCAKS